MVQELRRFAVFQLRLYPGNGVALTALDPFVGFIIPVASFVVFGYYPFQDCDPYYFQKGEPQYEAVAKVGFDYYVTYLDQNKPARIVGQIGKMTILNQQTQKWFPWFQEEMGDEHSRGELKKMEAKIAADADEWIVMTYDAPFFGLSPIYLGGVRSQYDATGPERMGMKKIVDAMMYVRDGGGDSKRLFLVKPHELARYARLRRDLRRD